MPLVRRELPEAHLTIAGRNPGPAVRALEHVVPDVPDLRPYLWGAAVYACPMVSGTGIKNKLLEAMAAGAPAVATSLATQGIDARHVLVADSDAEFAAGLVDAADGPPTRRRAGRGGARVRARATRLGRGRRRVPRPLPGHRLSTEIGETSAPSVVSGGLWTLLNRVLPQAQLLVLSIIVARYLGPTEMGRQSFIAFVSIALVQAATAGFPIALSRFVGELLGARRGGEALSLYRLTRRVELRGGGALPAGAGHGRAARRRPARGVDAGRAERRVRGPAGRADGAAGGRAALA